MFSRPHAPKGFHSWWVRRSTPGSSAAVSVTITARKTTRSPNRSLKNAKGCARQRHGTARHGVDLRTAALQFSATPDLASALVVGAASEQQIVADFSSMQVKIPAEFWAELKERKLIEQDAPVPA
jgi:aryl-alcohol dehydrogenase-like predicted oxidoreductase